MCTGLTLIQCFAGQRKVLGFNLKSRVVGSRASGPRSFSTIHFWYLRWTEQTAQRVVLVTGFLIKLALMAFIQGTQARLMPS